MEPADIKQLLEQNALLMKAQSEQNAVILKLLSERDKLAGEAGVYSNSGSKEMLMSSLGSRMEAFRYMPEDDLTFENWWLRYGSVIEKDGAALPEDAKVRLLIGKLQASEFSRFCDAVKPKGPYESTLLECLSTLKTLFSSTKSLFMKRYECFQLKQKVGQDILQYGAIVNGSCESAKPPINGNALKCLVFLSGLHSDFHELRIKCLQKLETAESENRDLKLEELLEECKKHLALKENVRSLNKQFNTLSTNAVGSSNGRKYIPRNPIKPAGAKNKRINQTFRNSNPVFLVVFATGVVIKTTMEIPADIKILLAINVAEWVTPACPSAKCQFGSARGIFNLSSTVGSNTSYNIPQKCGCSTEKGWNCTFNDYPSSQLNHLLLNTTDVLWDLSHRNISQYRLITSENTTNKPSNHLFLGGWTFGHINVQSPSAGRVNNMVNGLDTFLAAMENASSTIQIDWRAAVRNTTSWSSTNDSFNPNMTVLEALKKFIGNLDTTDITKVWFNNKLYSSLPINTNSYHNAVLRSMLPKENATKVGILAFSQPMNQTIKESMNNQQAQRTLTFRIVLLLLVMCVIPSSFAMFLVEERVTFSKHLQRIFGIAPWLYQFTNFLYDFTFYFMCSLAIICIYSFMGVTFFTYSISAFCCALLAFGLYGTSCILFVNILQLLFTTPSLAFALITCGTFFVGVVTTMTIMLLENLMSNDETLQLAHNICSIVFLILPQYNLGMVIYRLNFLNVVYTTGFIFLNGINRPDLASQLPMPNPLSWELAGIHCVVLLGLSLFFLVVLLGLEYRSRLKFLRTSERLKTQRLLKSENSLKHRLIDPDVLKEQDAVDRLDELDDYGLVVKNVSKAYGSTHLAVNNLSFAVGKGQCFGLLGVNGAGKTTTFSMLTGVLDTCSGDVIVNGNSILRDGDSCFRHLGYCPQIDALAAKMTAREHLAFYARVRGIREEDIQLVVDWGLEHMQLKAYADEQSHSYSGGNKRKLAAAIALVADPPVVLLDEPSAGMDPSTQQFMWNLILQLRRSRRTVVITSHSMEECEFLCTRIAIMVNGQFECIGSIQHLKERFGEGYTLTLKICSAEQVDIAQKFIETHLPGAQLRSLHCTTLFYKIQQGEMALAKAFRVINQMEKVIKVEDYSLSQTTLDDVFVSFASNSLISPPNENINTVSTATTTIPDHHSLQPKQVESQGNSSGNSS